MPVQPDSDKEREMAALLPAMADFQNQVTEAISKRKPGWYRIGVKIDGGGHVIDIRGNVERTYPIDPDTRKGNDE